MAAAAAEVNFWDMNEVELRQWVEANPGRVNDRDRNGHTPLYTFVSHLDNLSLTVWLLDEKGADVNGRAWNGRTPLHAARPLDIVTALLNRGANPTLQGESGWSPLMQHTCFGRADGMKCLLEDPRVRGTVDVQNHNGDTALHFACDSPSQESATVLINVLLKFGADLTIATKWGEAPLAVLRLQNPTHHTTIALLEQAIAEAETTSHLVKARCLSVAARSDTVAPSCLKSRVALGESLPDVALTAVGSDGEGHKFRTMLNFLFGIGGGPKGDGMPRDAFRVVLDLRGRPAAILNMKEGCER